MIPQRKTDKVGGPRPESVLFIDDEAHILVGYQNVLSLAGFENLVPCQDPRETFALVQQHAPGVIILDLTMPHVSGEDLLGRLIASYPHIPVIVVTGNDDVATAVRCVRAGAYDYLVKPISKERLLVSVTRALDFTRMDQETQRLRTQLDSHKERHSEAFAPFNTQNDQMLALFEYAEAVAPSELPVLITGETGVGKEVMARAIHEASSRTGKFVPVNVAGLDDQLLADTLFGHVKGAFTGAERNRAGMIEQAQGGTLFLDEIGDLTPQSQVKLLRLLQEREYQPLGSDETRTSRARILAATNQDLRELQEAGTFRKDLYYRLCAHRVHIPPLRERKDDLPQLLERFIGEAAKALKRPKPRLPDGLLPRLYSLTFPGNLRELQSMVADAVSRCRSDQLSLADFQLVDAAVPFQGDRPGQGQAGDAKIVFGLELPTVDEAKGMLIEEAIRRARGNKSRAAEMIGLSRQTLNARIRRRH